MQFSCWPAAVVIRQEGDRPVLITLLASKFYECLPDWQLGQSARLALLANQGFGPYDQITKKLDKIQRVNSGSDLQDNATEKDRAIMTNAFDDLRKLGELDLRLNYPNIHKLN
jgi:hypothetical protein